MIRAFSIIAILIATHSLLAQKLLPQNSNTILRAAVQSQTGNIPYRPHIKLGIDVLADQGFAPLLGKRVGL